MEKPNSGLTFNRRRFSVPGRWRLWKHGMGRSLGGDHKGISFPGYLHQANLLKRISVPQFDVLMLAHKGGTITAAREMEI